jgi:SAM-dependent methyltransferase
MKRLNFGSGNNIKSNWDNCDIQKGKGIISFDFNIFPYPIKEDTYDYVETQSVIQMLEYPDKVLNELWRICKKGATIHIITSHWHNKGAYNDIQTRHFFNENTFINFANNYPCRVNDTTKFRIINLIREPTKVGMFIPAYLRSKLDLFISGLYGNMQVELEVVK